MSNSKSYKRDLTARMRELGFTPAGVVGSGHLWFQHEHKHVEHVSAASSPGDADEQIRIVLGKAKRAMRAANIDVDEYQDRARVKAFHALPGVSEHDVADLLLESDQIWHTVGEVAHQLDTDLNDTATVITQLENRGVIVRTITDDGPYRFAAAGRIAPTKEEPVTTQDVTDWRGISVPAAVLEQTAGKAEKLADGWRTLMQVLESHGGYLPSTEAVRLAAAGSSASEQQIRKIATPGEVVIWRELKKQGGTFWALPGVEVPGARIQPPSPRSRTTAAPAPQRVPAGVTPPPAPPERLEDSTAEAPTDSLRGVLLAAVDDYVAQLLESETRRIAQLERERDEALAKLEQIEDVLTAASSGIKIS